MEPGQVGGRDASVMDSGAEARKEAASKFRKLAGKLGSTTQPGTRVAKESGSRILTPGEEQIAQEIVMCERRCGRVRRWLPASSLQVDRIKGG